jgi:hypothetical protein
VDLVERWRKRERKGGSANCCESCRAGEEASPSVVGRESRRSGLFKFVAIELALSFQRLSTSVAELVASEYLALLLTSVESSVRWALTGGLLSVRAAFNATSDAEDSWTEEDAAIARTLCTLSASDLFERTAPVAVWFFENGARWG